jgi:hypothetical protein
MGGDGLSVFFNFFSIGFHGADAPVGWEWRGIIQPSLSLIMNKLHLLLMFSSRPKNLNIISNLFLIFCCLIFQEAKSQEVPCAAFSYEDAIMLADKNYAAKKEQAENLWVLKARQGAEKSSSVGMLTIPVAVHVVHMTSHGSGSGSNLDLGQVEAAIDFLNSVYQGNAINPVTNATMPIEIAFCLADVNNHGNDDFSNLNRDVEDNPSQQSASIKSTYGNIADYPRTDYMNIWVVNEVCQNAGNCSLIGYSTLAPAHGSWYDGIVIEADNFYGYGLAHEVGHYLNLKHTFGPFDNQADCTNGNCLSDNDCVCDTRPDGTLFSCAVTNTCHTDDDDTSTSNPFGTDENDPIGNIMDYCDQWSYFTIGQRDRMRTAIEETRSSLLLNNGACCTPVLQAKFTFQYTNGNTAVNLDASSSQGVPQNATYAWEVNGTVYGPDTLPTLSNIPISGVLQVCLTVSGGSCSDVFCNSVGSAPLWDGCNDLCNHEFELLDISPFPPSPFGDFGAGHLQCWECALGSPDYRTINVGNIIGNGSARMVKGQPVNNTEAVKGLTQVLKPGKSYIFSMYKLSEFNNTCGGVIGTKSKVVIDVDTNADGIAHAAKFCAWPKS